MKFTKKENADLQLDLTSLIDVVFLLLIFFMVTTTFIQAPGLKVDLPKSQTQEFATQAKDIVISIDNRGKLAFKDKQVTLPDLKKELLSLPRSTVMVLRADSKSAHGRVVEVMDLIKTLGFTELAIATDPFAPYYGAVWLGDNA